LLSTQYPVLITRLKCGLGPEDQRAHLARNAPSAVDHTEVVFGHLAWPRPTHNLARGLDHVAEAARQARLATGDLAALRVDREGSLVGRVRRLVEGADLALLAEAGVLQRRRHQDRVAVVELRELHVGGPVAGHLEGARRRDPRRRGGDAGVL